MLVKSVLIKCMLVNQHIIYASPFSSAFRSVDPSHAAPRALPVQEL